jgi:YggT family protein
VVRAGGMPTAAPWWALVAVVLGGIAIILALQFALDVLASAAFAASGGPRQIAVLLVDWAFGILKLALILRVVASWLRLSTWAWYLRWTVALTEWLLRPLRRVLPPFGMIDISPIVAYFVLALLQSLVLAQVR